jgi:hypothetical protein
MDYEAYARFVLQHHAELNLSYPFAMKLSFLASPLVLGKAMLVFSEETYEPVGALGAVYGTGANEYEDRQVCQLEVAYMKREHRRPGLFIQSLTRLLAAVQADNPDVERVQFWISAEHAGKDKLYSRFAALPGATVSAVNEHMLYAVAYRELAAYCRSFTRVQ